MSELISKNNDDLFKSPSISEGFLHSIFSGLRRILGSWNLVNPLLRMNEAWMDECAARLQLLVDQYKNPDNTKLSQ